MDHHSVIQEVPMLRTEKQYDDEPVVDSNLRRQLTRRTRSTVSSISIPIDTSQLDPSCERETNHIVGGRPLSATPGTGNRFLMQQIRDETGNEVVVEIDGNQNNNNHNNHDSINEHLQKAGPRGMCNDPYCTTCPTYFQGSQQTNPKASSTFTDSKVKNSSGDGKGFGRKLFSFCSSCVPEVMNPHAKVVQRWNQILAIFCLVAIFVDPLFLFVIYVKKDDKCIAINWAMAKTLVLLRSINDFVYFLNMLLQFRLAYVSPKSRVVLDDRPKEIALHYLKGHFIFDFLLVLPLPQGQGSNLQLRSRLRLLRVRLMQLLRRALRPLRHGKIVMPPGQRLQSNKTVTCLTNVEAFSLHATDIEEVAILFPSFLQRPHVQSALSDSAISLSLSIAAGGKPLRRHRSPPTAKPRTQA